MCNYLSTSAKMNCKPCEWLQSDPVQPSAVYHNVLCVPEGMWP